MANDQGLSAANEAFLERLYSFGPPLPAQFVFTRDTLNDLINAARSEGLPALVGEGE